MAYSRICRLALTPPPRVSRWCELHVTYPVKEIGGTEYSQIETLAKQQIETLAKQYEGEIFGSTFDGRTMICLASFRGLSEELQFIEACRDAGFTARKMLTDYQENITYPIDEIS